MQSLERGRLPRRAPCHDIDTQAVLEVRSALPSNWEARELSPHDYGFDLQVELFKQASPLGRLLLMQIKGMTRISTERSISYQIPVRTILYAELFAVPVLAAVALLGDARRRFVFVWLQDYVAVVLDPEAPDWRRQDTVAHRFPVDNVQPNAQERPEWIAGHLDRMRAVSRLASPLMSCPTLL